MPRESHPSQGRQPISAAQPRPYIRTTITVPPELKARMEAVGSQINWSAVACEAFEARLASHMPEEPPMPELPKREDAVDRLRRLKNQPESTGRRHASRAFLLGKHWAMSDAHPNELARLEAFCRQYEVNRPVGDWKISLHDRGAFKKLFRELTLSILGFDRLADVDRARAEMQPFWEQRVGVVFDRTQAPGAPPDPEFVSGFTQGALEFWEDVKRDV